MRLYTLHPAPPGPACCSVKHSLSDENVASKLSPDDVAKAGDEVEAALRWIANNSVS